MIGSIMNAKCQNGKGKDNIRNRPTKETGQELGKITKYLVHNFYNITAQKVSGMQTNITTI